MEEVVGVTIDAYLAELSRLLPRTARLRALAEVREHLRDSAARHRAAGVSPGDAELRATGEFGEVELVAHRLGGELAIRETRIAALLALAAVAFFVFPFYVVPENTLPPATWVEKPYELLVLQRVALGLWLAAGVLAVASTALAWSRWPRTGVDLVARDRGCHHRCVRGLDRTLLAVGRARTQHTEPRTRQRARAPDPRHLHRGRMVDVLQPQPARHTRTDTRREVAAAPTASIGR